MIKKTLHKLFKIQCFLATASVIITKFIAHNAFVMSVAGGASVSLLATLVSMILFKRAPMVIGAKAFYQLMLVNEGLKWFVVVIACLLLLPYVQPLGLVVGFMVTYSGYFWMIYLDRGR